jgi:hypothetical protein
VRMDIVGVAIARAERNDSHRRGRRTEKRSAFHAHEFPPECLFCQRSIEMREVNTPSLHQGLCSSSICSFSTTVALANSPEPVSVENPKEWGFQGDS